MYALWSLYYTHELFRVHVLLSKVCCSDNDILHLLLFITIVACRRNSKNFIFTFKKVKDTILRFDTSRTR